MRVAVIGAGIAGLSSAWHLDQRGVEVVVYEQARRIGGHTHTHAVGAGGLPVDTGFIVFNHLHYPHFSAWLDELDVKSQPTSMSFAASDPNLGIEYGTASGTGLFGHPRQWISPSYWSMWKDLVRFYRTLGDGPVPAGTLGEYLERERYGAAFRNAHIVPMCSALWSQSTANAIDLSMRHVIEFMRNHQMLNLVKRPDWRVVENGSSTYLGAFVRRFNGTVKTDQQEVCVQRDTDRVVVTTRESREEYDQVVLACHADQALCALDQPSEMEREVLTAFPYTANDVTLHSDPSVMPSRKSCWASWNVVRDARGEFIVSYWMNKLQSLDSNEDYFVTLNPGCGLGNIHWRGTYHHPNFSRASDMAKPRWDEISGRLSRTHFAGAYWGAGFHEDGFVSGQRAARSALQALRTTHTEHAAIARRVA
jgi:predicted NAD/FAD-binding protein